MTRNKSNLNLVNDLNKSTKRNIREFMKNPIFQGALKQIEQAYSLANQELLKTAELYKLQNNVYKTLRDSQKFLDEINKRKAKKLIPTWRKVPRPGGYINRSQAEEKLEPIKQFMEDVDGIKYLKIPEINTDDNAILGEAIKDAQILLEKNGSPNAIDRVHTLLQAFLEKECDKSSINYKKESSINILLKNLRENHPGIIKLQEKNPHAFEILKGMGNTLSKFSEVRNNRSLAHPKEMLGVDEANFFIEAINAIIRYLSSKLR